MLTALDHLNGNAPTGFTVEIDNQYKTWDSPGNAYFLVKGGTSHGPHTQWSMDYLLRNLRRGCTLPRQIRGGPPKMISMDSRVEIYMKAVDDIVMMKRIKELLDTVESEEEFKELIKATRLGSIVGLTPEEQEILYEQRQPYQEYWETHVWMLPGEVKTMPPVETENPFYDIPGYVVKELPYVWEKPAKDTAFDSLLRIVKKRLDADRERWGWAHG